MSEFDIRDTVGTADSKNETPTHSIKNPKKREFTGFNSVSGVITKLVSSANRRDSTMWIGGIYLGFLKIRKRGEYDAFLLF